MKKVFLSLSLIGLFILSSTTMDAQIWRVSDDCAGLAKERYNDGDYMTVKKDGKTMIFKVAFTKSGVDLIPSTKRAPASAVSYELNVDAGKVKPSNAQSAQKLKTAAKARNTSSRANPKAGQSMGDLQFAPQKSVGGKKVIIVGCSNFKDLQGAKQRSASMKSSRN